jgi:hypothetical protein
MQPSTRLLRRGATAVLALCALAAVLAAPAGAATAPEKWGATFCTETVGWLQGAQQGANDLQTKASDPSITPADGKALIVEFLSTGVASTKAYGQALKAAGAPNIKNGAKIQASILAGIAGSGAKLTVLNKVAKKIPTRPPAAFQKAATKLGNQLSSFSEPFSKGMDGAGKLDSGHQLANILQSLPECAPLANGSGGTSSTTGG